MKYQLKLESRSHKKKNDFTSVDFIGGYDRISAKITIGGEPEPDIVLGVQNPEPAMREIQRWDPMQLMCWRYGPDGPESSAVDIVHVYLYSGDKLWLMNENGQTVDRLF